MCDIIHFSLVFCTCVRSLCIQSSFMFIENREQKKKNNLNVQTLVCCQDTLNLRNMSFDSQEVYVYTQTHKL